MGKNKRKITPGQFCMYYRIMKHLRQLNKKQNNKCSLQKRVMQSHCCQKWILQRNRREAREMHHHDQSRSMKRETERHSGAQHVGCWPDFHWASSLPCDRLYLQHQIKSFHISFLSSLSHTQLNNPLNNPANYLMKPAIRLIPNTIWSLTYFLSFCSITIGVSYPCLFFRVFLLMSY